MTHRPHRLPTGLALAGLLAAAGPAAILTAATLEIHNRAISLQYDQETKSFSLADGPTGRPFLTEGRIEGDARVRGSRIEVTGPDGVTTLELRGDEPFLFLTRSLRNTGPEPRDVRQHTLAEFNLDLGRPAGELRTLGTAGLTTPDQNPGSYLFLTCADPATRRGVVAGWLTEDRGSGVLFSKVRDGRVSFEARIDHGHLLLPPHSTTPLETLVVGCFADARLGEERYADLIKQHYHIRLRPQPPVYCTWYSEKHGQAGDEKSTLELARFAARELSPYGFGCVQIDDEWQDSPKFNGPRRGFDRVRPDGPYAHGIAPVAEEVSRLGLTFGLWWLPFGRNYQDPEYQDRQDWFVKRADGKPFDTSWGGTCLDLTHPEVQAQLARIAKLYRSWGVKYYKMDGLWTGTASEQIYVNDGYKEDHLGNNRPFHDPRVSNIESYRNGLKLLRRAAGDDVFFSGCCVAQNMRELTAIGLVDSMRIGPDYNADGQGIRTGPLRGSRLYFLNGRVWWNDPDPAKLGASDAKSSADDAATGAASLDQARLGASWVAIAGQFFLASDWLPDLPPERLDIMKRCIPAHQATVRPVDCFDTPLPRIWLLEAAPHQVLGLYNWDKSAGTIACDAARAGLDGAKTYHAFDFWERRPLPDFKGAFSYDLRGQSCRVIAVRPSEGHPVIVSTSRHVTQGVMDLSDEEWKRGTLSATSRVVGGDPYEVRIAGMHGWRATSVRAPHDVAIKLLPAGEGWQRLVIESTTSRPVKWSMECRGQ